MVRRVTYDYKGHRIRDPPEQNGGKLELPPISNEGSRQGSASSNGKKSADGDENYKKLGDEIIGVMYAACLSRRKMDGNGGMTFLPELHSKPISASVRTTRSEPYYLDYGRNRLIYEKNYGRERNQFRGRNLKEFVTDKIITILDRPEKRAATHPRRECRCVVNETRFRDLNDFMEELTKVLNVNDRERFLHSEKYNTVVRNLADLEDGGEYYIAASTYTQSSVEASTPESVENELDGEGAKRNERGRGNGASKYWSARKDRKKKVIIMANHANGVGTGGTFSFIVDEAKHRSMLELCQDISASINTTRHGYGAIERVCLRNGRTCMSVSEIFHSPDDTLIAVIGTDPYGIYDDPYARGGGYRGMLSNGRAGRRLSTLGQREHVDSGVQY